MHAGRHLLTLLVLAGLVGCAPAPPAHRPGPGVAAPSVPPPAGFAPSPATGLPVPADAQEAVVVRVSDGDTVVLRGRGVGPLRAEPTRVRILLIDTPEVTGTPQCFGPEATARTAQLLPPGAPVRVEADRRRTDRFGRTLLHVWTADGTHVGQSLLSDGYARLLHLPPNDRYLEPLARVERQARQDGRGLWAACP